MIDAQIDRLTGRVQLRFPYRPNIIKILKEIPGSRWDPDLKCWNAPIHSWGALAPRLLPHKTRERTDIVPIHQHFTSQLRPYQIEGAEFLIKNRRGLLAFAPRVGKTPTSIAAASALLEHNRADTVVVIYPAGVRDEWKRQLKRWANIDLICIEEQDSLLQCEIDKIRAQPWTFLGIAWTSIRDREVDLGRLLDRRRYVVIGDEAHLAQNMKAKRAKALKRLCTGTAWIKAPTDDVSQETAMEGHGTPVAIWALSGTPMRNRNENMYGLLEFMCPNGMSWSRFVARYCGGEILEHGYHWDYEDVVYEDGRKERIAVQKPGHRNTKGASNSDELKKRIDFISLRKTRADVAAWLPASDDTVIACDVPAGFLKRYRSLERQIASRVDLEMTTAGSREAVKALALATSQAKIPTAIERAKAHLERGVKVIVAAYFHESLKAMDEAISLESGQTWTWPVFRAGGWETPALRAQRIAAWKAQSGPALLLCNVLSSGVGIDLADAEVSILIEPVWVPADLQQFRDRIVDLHHGKVTTPRIYETLAVPGTIDSDMLAAVLKKIRGINDVGLGDAELTKIGSTIRDSGVVNSSNIALETTDESAVQAALDGLMARWSNASAQVTEPDLVDEIATLDDDDPEEGTEDESDE